MEHVDLTKIEGLSDLLTDLTKADALGIPVVTPEKQMAYAEAEYVFNSLVQSVKPSIIDHTLRIACSFGKDSTLLLSVFVEAFRQIVQDGQQPKSPLIITYADTRIESPVMSLYANRQIALLEEYLSKNKIPHEIYSAKPADRHSWPVLYISGLKLLTVGASRTADCSVELKQQPLQGVESQLAKKYGNQVVTVTGVRISESELRKQTIIELGLNKAQIVRSMKNGVESLDYAPIVNITTDEVWMMLRCLGVAAKPQYGAYLPYWDESTWYLSKLYADQTDSCPIVGSGAMSSSRSGGCSSSLRSGCSLCTTVNIDKQASALADLAQYPQLKNLLAIRNWLSHTYFDLSYRRFVARKYNEDGYVKIEPKSFNEQWMTKVLRWVLQADADERIRALRFRQLLANGSDWMNEPGVQSILQDNIPGWQKASWLKNYLMDMQFATFELVTPSQLLLIDALWSRDSYKLPPFSALAIWRSVNKLHERVPYPEIEGKKAINNLPAARYFYIGDQPEFELLRTDNEEFLSRFMLELSDKEVLVESRDMRTVARMERSRSVLYGEEAGKTFGGWFGDFEQLPMVMEREDGDDSGYIVDEEVAYMILDFCDDFVPRGDRYAGEYRTFNTMRRLVNLGALRLSQAAQRNSARIAARSWMYEVARLVDLADVMDPQVMARTISEAEYLALSGKQSMLTTPEKTVLEQLNDLKAAAKSVRELYRRLCQARAVAMLTVSEMGESFVFDGCAYQSLVNTQTMQIQTIVRALNSVNGILTLLPKNAPLRQTKALPPSVSKLLHDFVGQLMNEFKLVEQASWQTILTLLPMVLPVGEVYPIVGLGQIGFIRDLNSASQYVSSQVALRDIKLAS